MLKFQKKKGSDAVMHNHLSSRRRILGHFKKGLFFRTANKNDRWLFPQGNIRKGRRFLNEIIRNGPL